MRSNLLWPCASVVMCVNAGVCVEGVCVLTHITAQSGVGFGLFDLGQILGQCVLVLCLFIACFVIQLKDEGWITNSNTTFSSVLVSTVCSWITLLIKLLYLSHRYHMSSLLLFTHIADKLSIFPCENNLGRVGHWSVLDLVNMLPAVLLHLRRKHFEQTNKKSVTKDTFVSILSIFALIFYY